MKGVKYVSGEPPQQGTLDEALVDKPQVGAQSHNCIHCFVVVFDESSQMVATVCAHKCGAVKDKRPSLDAAGDKDKARRTQEAFRLSHVRGCPRDRRRFYSMIP